MAGNINIDTSKNQNLFKSMKQITVIIILSLLMACSSDSEKTSQNHEEKMPAIIQVSDKKTSTATTSKGTYLCKINGKDWAYTKASGILSTHAKTKKRTAIITFKKKLEKGSETIQLYYDANSFELTTASLLLKFKNKESRLFTCHYKINSENKNLSPKSTMSGTIDLSNPTSASGTAKASNINILYKKENLFDSKNEMVNLTDLKFSGVGYSNLDKVTNAFKK